MINFQNQYCRITVQTDDSVIHLTWLEQPSMEELKACYTKGLDMAIAHQVKYVIADNSIGITLDLATQRWIAEASASREGQNHIRRYARIVPIDAFQEMVTYKIGENYNSISNSKIQFEVFYSLEMAKEWVLSGDVAAKEKTKNNLKAND